MRRVQWLLVVAALGMVAAGTQRTRPFIPAAAAGVELLREVKYGVGGGRPLTLHILRPREQAADPAPALVWVHGGGWQSGDKEGGVRLLTPFARRGYLCATIEYRLSGEAVWPAQIEDCKCAIRFLRARAQEYRLDPERIGVWGASAGGHLAALLGAAGDEKALEGEGGWPDQASRVQAVCDWFGPADFTPLLRFPRAGAALGMVTRFLGGTPQQRPAAYRQASPVAYVTPDDPPFLIMHGDRDPLVPWSQSETLFEALQDQDVEATLVRVEGAGHGFAGPEIMALVEAFFDRHLKGDSAAWNELAGEGRFNRMTIEKGGR